MKQDAVTDVEEENERDETYQATNPQIDSSRTKDNYHIVIPSGRYMDVIEERIAGLHLKRKVRSDAVYIVSFVLGASPEFFKVSTKEKQYAFFRDCVKFFQDKYGEENVLSAIVHMDETNPHKMKVIFNLKGGQKNELLLNLIFPDYPDGNGGEDENSAKEKETENSVSLSGCSYTPVMVLVAGVEPARTLVRGILRQNHGITCP